MTHPQTLCIEDFCKTGSGGTPSRAAQSKFYDGGTIPWVKSGELRESVIINTEENITHAALAETSVKLVPKGAILLAMYGATVGRLALLGVEATTNQAVCHIIPDPEIADTRYLYYALSSQVPSIIAMGVGGAQPNISQGLIKSLRIWLPSLPEQRRIAAILDKADALRTKRREAMAQLDRLAQSIFVEMFGDPTRPGMTGSRPYSMMLLGDLVKIQTGKLDANAAVTGGEYPFFTCSAKNLEIDKAAFDCKAILVAGNGDLNVKYYEGKFNAYQRTYVIQSKNDEILQPKFLYQFLDIYISELRRQAIGGVIKYIKLPYLENAPINISNIESQLDFVERFDAVINRRKEIVNALAVSEKLFASLQNSAFRGGL